MNFPPDSSVQESLIGDRKINQDRCAMVEDSGAALLVLGDGMGGHPRGEMAAQILADTCESYFQSTPKPILNPKGFLNRLLQKAHEGILAFGYDQEPAIDPRTTAVVALIQNSSAYWAHTGDSRLYLLRNNRVQAKTTDHSYVERLKQQGVISAKEQQTHPQRNYVTRCLGGSITSPEVSFGKHKLEVGDVLLLCSDGLWGQTSEQKLLEQIFSGQTLSNAVRKLVENATHNAFPNSDNTSLIALKIDTTEDSAATEEESTTAPRTEKSNLADAIAELQNALNTFEQNNKQEKK